MDKFKLLHCVSMLKFPSDYRRSRPVLSLIQTLASKYLKSIIGRFFHSQGVNIGLNSIHLKHP